MQLRAPLDELIVTWPFGATSDDPRLAGIIHQGVDLRAAEGTPVVAAADGQAFVLSQGDGGFGKYIRLELGRVALDGRGGTQVTGNVMLYYAHLSETIPSQRVRRGQVIGRTGDSGFTIGAHLHWELRVNGRPMDPLLYTEGYMGDLQEQTQVAELAKRVEALEAQLGQTREAAIAVRYALEADVVRALKRADALEAEAERIRAAVWRTLQDMVSTRDGMAYVPEILTGGPQPPDWEGEVP